MNTEPGPGGGEIPGEDLKDLRIVLPRGLVAAPALLPRCSQLEFIAEECSPEAVVGRVSVSTDRPEEGDEALLYNLEPQVGSPAELGFVTLQLPVRLKVAFSPDPPYALVASIEGVSQTDVFFGAELEIEGNPGGTPLLTLPRSCDGPLRTAFEAESWQRQGAWTPPAVVESPGLSGCEQLLFDPAVDSSPTTAFARATSGLAFTLDAPDAGLTSPTANAHADLKAVEIALPEGMTVNASVAGGLGACTRTDYAREALGDAPGEGCPEAAKIGTATVTTPVLGEPVQGSIYVAQPDDPSTAAPGAENPFDSLIALYLVLENPRLGVLAKLAMRVEADPASGRLTASLDEIPQLPITRFELRFREGPRAPLVTPSGCGSHSIHFALTPSSGAAPLVGDSRFVLDGGCGGGGFRPNLTAGSSDARAGAVTAFQVAVTRSESEDNLSSLTVNLPRGLTANLGAVPLCPDGSALDGACPPDSRIGSAHVVAGSGTMPLQVPPPGSPAGGVYLAGPYEGARFSLVAAVPARVGPFDLGTVTLRGPIFVDRRTGQASIRFAGLPQLLEGIPISYRALRIVLDRPGFVRNPTSCQAATIEGSATSSAGARAPLASRFQVGGCAGIPFKPKIGLKLLGATHRGARPALRAVVRGRPGDANIGRVTATLPASELLNSRGIDTVCTVQRFDASNCPATSVRGRARVWTPLFERPLEGPVYLRSGSGRLPDLAAALDGPLRLDLVAGVDAVEGRLRVSLRGLPDVPLSKVVLTLQGGANGLLVNAGDVCGQVHRLGVAFAGKNGKRHIVAPRLRTSCRSTG
jgi:hypothetical protein